MLIYSSSKLRTAQMMIFSLVAMIGLEKCCITSACLQWLCHSGERTVARGPLVSFFISTGWLVKQATCLIFGILVERTKYWGLNSSLPLKTDGKILRSIHYS